MKFITSLAGLLVAFSLAACSSSKPEDVIKNYYENVNKGNIQALIESVNPDTLANTPQAKSALTSIATEAIASTAKKGGAVVEIVSATVTGDVAEVEANVRYGDGAKNSFKTKLLKVDGKWYINI